MATCVVQQMSTQSPIASNFQKIFHSISYDSREKAMQCRKRFLSERNVSSMKFPHNGDALFKRIKTGNCVILLPMWRPKGNIVDICFRLYSRSFSSFLQPTCDNARHHLPHSLSFQLTDLFYHESKNTHTRYRMRCFSLAPHSERKQRFRSAPSHLRRQSLTHYPTFAHIKDAASTQTAIISCHSTLSTSSKTTTTENIMLVCPQTPTVLLTDSSDTDYSSLFLTTSELAAFINNTNQAKLLIDCGSSLRHTERRIQDSLLLNFNDKISRKRLATRGLKVFLDVDQLNRLNKNNLIILYDDSTHTSSCSCSSIQSQLPQSMKCIYDEIKRFDVNKTIFVLQSSFDDFYEHYPSLCHITTSINDDQSTTSADLSSPMKQWEIDYCPISEIIPGLYLGNSRDAQNLDLLKQHQIRNVINASTSIPCYFESEQIFDYLRLPCQDSTNQNILQYFQETFDHIHQKLSANENVFVHCQGGISRSPSFVIGYLMKYRSKSFDEAYNMVKTRRNIVSPNLNFLGQLTQYQQMLINA